MSPRDLEQMRARRQRLELPWTHVDDHFIDGDWRTSAGTGRTELTDPATGDVWGSVPQAAPEDVEAAVGAAHRAFHEGPWRHRRPSERAEVLRRAADLLEQDAQALASTNTRENGSPIAETAGAAANAAGILRHMAGEAGWLEAEDVRPFPNGQSETRVYRDPIGPCALIAPWNFPINLVMVKLAPALLAGCTAVIKPAPSTPLSIRFVVRALHRAGVPAGAVNLISGEGQVGEALVRDPRIAKVAFTGSTGVGRRIAAACGELLKPVTLELGGKSSAIVMEDADPQVLSDRLIRSCLRNTGQTCYISTRILAPESRYQEIVELSRRVVEGALQDDPLLETTVFGPMAHAAQHGVVRRYLDSARAEGAHVATGGGALEEPGSWIQPTVLSEVTEDMTVAREEIFGPVLTILRYRDLDHAVQLANGTPYGLGGVVFGQDQQAALELARRVDTGSIGLNFFASNHSAPFGGRHDSGLGVEYGLEGLSAYLTFQSVHRRPL